MNTSFATVGGLSRVARAMPADVLAMASRLNVEPAMVIDGRPLFSADDARRIIEAIGDRTIGGNHLAARANHLS